MKLVLISILTAFIFCSLANAETIYMKDGKIYPNVKNLKEIGNLFLFNYNGNNVSISKYKIDKIVGDNNNIVFENVTLIVKKVRKPSGLSEYIFLKNDVEVGRGNWITNGIFSISSRNIPDGIYIQYFDSGGIERKFSIKNGNLNGKCHVYYDSGILQRQSNFINGKEEGLSKLYYENGRLKGESVFANGAKNGKTKLFFESGNIKSLMNFKNDLADGKQVMYYESGAIETIVYFKQGRRSGPIKQFYESGKLKMEGKFDNGKLNGNVSIYYESGKIKKQNYFLNGRIVRE